MEPLLLTREFLAEFGRVVAARDDDLVGFYLMRCLRFRSAAAFLVGWSGPYLPASAETEVTIALYRAAERCFLLTWPVCG